MQLRLLASAMLAAVLTASLGSGAAAGDQWCEWDPVVVITTPGGSIVPVYVTNGAEGAEHSPAVLVARMSYTAQPTWDGGGTLVHLTVVIPGDHFGDFAAASVVSSGPLKTGTIFAGTTGRSNAPMQMVFALPQR